MDVYEFDRCADSWDSLYEWDEEKRKELV